MKPRQSPRQPVVKPATKVARFTPREPRQTPQQAKSNASKVSPKRAAASATQQVSSRLAAVREHIANLRLALEGLVDLGLCVASVDMLNGRGKPVLTMAPSPYLHRICHPVHIGQKQIGNTRFLRFTAEFGGVTLDWWESVREAA
jgi:hypothetical protein